MKKMNSGKKTPPWCPFSNNRLRSVLEFLKLRGCRKKKPPFEWIKSNVDLDNYGLDLVIWIFCPPLIKRVQNIESVFKED